MATYAKILQDTNGNMILPYTRDSLVYTSSNKLLSDIMVLCDDSVTVPTISVAEQVWASAYPIGSIYMSVNSTSPATLFGGTWEQIQNTFLIAAGSSYIAGSTGGSETHTHTTGDHTLTISEMPSHTHAQNVGGSTVNGSAGTDSGVTIDGNVTWSSNKIANQPTGSTITQSAGGGASHNHGNTGSSSNMPPYLAVYMWKRTA